MPITIDSLEFLLSFNPDEDGSLDKALERLRAIAPAVEAIHEEMRAVRAEATELRQQAERLQSISLRVAAVGGAVVVAFQKSAQQYVKAVGMSEETSARWLKTTSDLERSQVRLGRAAAEAVQPYRDGLARIVDYLADIAEKSPALAKALYAGGQLLAGGGGIGTLVAQGMRIKADITLLAAARMQEQAAEKMLLAAGLQNKAAGTGALTGAGGTAGLFGKAGAAVGTITVLASSLVIGGAIGLNLGNALGRAIYGENYKDQDLKDIGDTIKRYLASAAGAALLAGNRMSNAITGQTGVSESTQQSWLNIKEFLGVLTDTDRAAMAAAGSLSAVNRALENSPAKNELLSAFMGYRDQMTQITEQYEKARTKVVREYAQQRAQLEAQYEKSRNQLISDYSRQRAAASRAYMDQERQAAAEYARQRAQLAQQFAQDMQRAEENFQLQMKQLSEDHEGRVRDLVEARDALGLAREQEDYERERSQAQEAHDLEMSRRRDDYAIQLAELQQNFEVQRAQRAAAYRQQQAEAAANFQQELARLDEEHKAQMDMLDQQQKETLANLDEGYREQVEQAQTAFVDRIRTLDATILSDYAAYQAHLMAMSQQFQDWLKKYNASPTTPFGDGRQTGGYVERAGSYRLAEDGRREFVLNNRTTQAAERIVGGRLSERALLAALAKRGVSGNTFNFGEDANQITRDKIVTWMTEVTEEIFD